MRRVVSWCPPRGEPRVHKRFNSTFEQTALEAHQETLKEGKAVLTLLNDMISSYSTVFDPVEQEALQRGRFKPLALEN